MHCIGGDSVKGYFQSSKEEKKRLEGHCESTKYEKRQSADGSQHIKKTKK